MSLTGVLGNRPWVLTPGFGGGVDDDAIDEQNVTENNHLIFQPKIPDRISLELQVKRFPSGNRKRGANAVCIMASEISSNVGDTEVSTAKQHFILTLKFLVKFFLKNIVSFLSQLEVRIF